MGRSQNFIIGLAVLFGIAAFTIASTAELVIRFNAINDYIVAGEPQ